MREEHLERNALTGGFEDGRFVCFARVVGTRFSAGVGGGGVGGRRGKSRQDLLSHQLWGEVSRDWVREGEEAVFDTCQGCERGEQFCGGGEVADIGELGGDGGAGESGARAECFGIGELLGGVCGEEVGGVDFGCGDGGGEGGGDGRWCGGGHDRVFSI